MASNDPGTTRSTSISRTRSIPTLRSRPVSAVAKNQHGLYTAKSSTQTIPPVPAAGQKSLLRKPSMPLRGASTRTASQAQSGPRFITTSAREVERKPSTSRLGLELGLPNRATGQMSLPSTSIAAGTVGKPISKIKRKPLPARSMLDLRRMNAAAATASSTSTGPKANISLKPSLSKLAPEPTVAVPPTEFKANPLGPKRAVPTMSSSTRVAPTKLTSGLLARKASMPILTARPAPAPAPAPALPSDRVDNVFGPSTSACSAARLAVPAKGLAIPTEEVFKARPRIGMVVAGKRFSKINATPSKSFSSMPIPSFGRVFRYGPDQSATPSPTKRWHQSTTESQPSVPPASPSRLATIAISTVQEEIPKVENGDNGAEAARATCEPSQTPLLPRLMGRGGQTIAFEHLPMIADESFSFEGSASTSSLGSVRIGHDSRHGPLLNNKKLELGSGSDADFLHQQELAMYDRERERDKAEMAKKEKQAEELRLTLESAQAAMVRIQAERDEAVSSEMRMKEGMRIGKWKEVEREVKAELERTREYREMLGIWRHALRGMKG